jgi:hypothetical protein
MFFMLFLLFGKGLLASVERRAAYDPRVELLHKGLEKRMGSEFFPQFRAVSIFFSFPRIRVLPQPLPFRRGCGASPLSGSFRRLSGRGVAPRGAGNFFNGG